MCIYIYIITQKCFARTGYLWDKHLGSFSGGGGLAGDFLARNWGH